jgi:alpha-beta hydrolase superfamily lysophospholipase
MPVEVRAAAEHRLGRLIALLLVVAVGAAAGACAPRVMPPGPGAAAPHLTDDVYVTADGFALPLRSWLPDGDPRAVLLALHGFNDYSAAFDSPARWWAERGLATYAYDQRGFGEAPHRGLWAGTGVMVDDLAEAARLLRARHPGRPLFLLGESMGAAVVMVAMAEGRVPEIDGAILSAPAVWARPTMPGYQRAALWLAVRLIPWADVTGEGVGVQASDNIEMLRGLGRDPLFIKRTRVDALYGLTNLMDAGLAASPRIEGTLFMLYGERDEIVPRAPVLAAWRALPGRDDGRQRMALYENGWHLLLRDLEAETVLADVAAWTEDPAAPLPSGADRRVPTTFSQEGTTP